MNLCYDLLGAKNIGLCCFYSGQYDLALSCFEYALQLANDSNMTEVWYNIGCVAISLGDTGLAQQAFGITLNLDNTYAEAYVNLGILEQRKGNLETARAHYNMAQKHGYWLHAPFYNGALLAYKNGDFQEALTLCNRAKEIDPEHFHTKELSTILVSNLYSS